MQNVEFLNAPVLFKEGGKSFQQVVASYRSEKIRKDYFHQEMAKNCLKLTSKEGITGFLLTFPAVTKPDKITITAKIDDKPAEKYPVTLVPPKKWADLFCSAFTH